LIAAALIRGYIYAAFLSALYFRQWGIWTRISVTQRGRPQPGQGLTIFCIYSSFGGE
jgi:hypothetical protein